MPRLPRLLSPAEYIRRNAFYKGLLGGQRGWIVVGGALFIGRIMRKALGKNEEVVALEKLAPGQWMSLRTIPPTTKREKKAAKLARKAA